MNRCCTCKHWQPTNDQAVLGNCLSDRLVYGGLEDLPSPLPLDILVYEDYEDYRAYLWTGPEFGCVHWEGQEEGT